jgi:hypothetical protein
MTATPSKRQDGHLRRGFKALAKKLGLAFRMHRVSQMHAPQGSARQIGTAADRSDDLDNGKYYTSDERCVELFDGVYFSSDRGSWIARFIPTHPERTRLERSESTYIEVLEFARLLHDSRIKPSESCKALQALDSRFDREVARLDFPNAVPRRRMPAP